MKNNIVVMAIVMSVLMSGMALGASETNEVYDFDEGVQPILFVPTNQSVDFWNEFTGLIVEEGDLITIIYTNVSGNETSVDYYVEGEDVDAYVNLTWNESMWIDVIGHGLFNMTMYSEVEIMINNKTSSVKSVIPLVPDFDEFDYEGMSYSILPIVDKDVTIDDEIVVYYVEEYEVPDDYNKSETGINWTADDESAIVFKYDDIEIPLTSYGFYMFEDESIFVQIGEIAEDAGGITYIVVSNYDCSEQGKSVTETRRYWHQEGETFTARYVTGTKNTFTVADAGDYSIIDVPDDNMARLTIGDGAWNDYEIEMYGDNTYSLSRLKRAFGVAENVDDLEGTDSDVLVVNGVYFQRPKVITLDFDDDDVLFFEENIIFQIDNSYDYGVKNWYAFGTKQTTWKVTGFGYF